MVHVAIVGTGDFAHGLAHVFQNNNTKSSGNTLVVTKPGFDKQTPLDFHWTGVQVCDFYQTVEQCDIVVLAIPSFALHGFIQKYAPTLLEGKILVDPTNSWKSGQDLSALLGTGGGNDSSSNLRWVKAFNDVGAVDLLSRHPQMKTKIASKMCSPDDEALEIVKNFAEISLGFCIKKVPFEHYAAISSHQNQVAGGQEWTDAIWTMAAVFIFTQMYNILRYNIAKGVSWRHYPTYLMNKGIAWSSLTGMALCQLPGILAHMSNVYHDDSLHNKPKFLLRFLAMRKHLGLISLWFLIVHIFMSSLIFGPNYYGAYFEDPKDPMSKMSLNGETAFMFGSFAAALYSILGVCSLPSVAEQMTNRQWRFVYGPVAWSALFLGTFHVICQGVGVTWNKKANWPWGLPPITLLSTVLPMFIMALKIVQVVWTKFKKAKKYSSEKDDRKKFDCSDVGDCDIITNGSGTGTGATSFSNGGSDHSPVEIHYGGDRVDLEKCTSTKLASNSNDGNDTECEIYIRVGSMPYFCENEMETRKKIVRASSRTAGSQDGVDPISY